MPAAWLLRVAAVALIGPAGVLIGHTLAYLVVVPDPARRVQVLAASGHAWWGWGTVAGAAMAAAGLTVLTCCLLRRSPDDGSFRRELARWLWPRLAAFQLGMFVLIETVERLVAHDPLSGSLYHEIIEHGAAAQLFVALALTGLLWCLALAVDLACVVIVRAPALAIIGLPPLERGRKYPLRLSQRLVSARAPPCLDCRRR